MIGSPKRKQRKLLAELQNRRRAEDDLLSPALRSRFDSVIDGLARASGAEIADAMKTAQREYAALPLPRRNWLYSLLDLIFVVGAIAFGLRGLFFQPFRIPTGSMQPTLYGIHYQERDGNANWGFAKLSGVLHHAVFGSADASVAVKVPGGALSGVREVPGTVFDRTEFFIGTDRYSLPGNSRQVADYAGWTARERWDGGETLGNGYVTLGDHLFVERFSLYLKPPVRGDIMVFNTEDLMVAGTPLVLSGGYYYIKRVAALPGDTVKLKGNQLWVRPAGAPEFRKIQDLAPEFGKIYSGRGGYQGHASGMGTEKFAFGEEFTVPENSYLMLGDNTRFSMDSRYFGAVPRRNLIGRAWFVFYPFSRRIGRVDRCGPVDEPTGNPGVSAFPVMARQ